VLPFKSRIITSVSTHSHRRVTEGGVRFCAAPLLCQ
jgi:hypothetical protein